MLTHHFQDPNGEPIDLQRSSSFTLAKAMYKGELEGSLDSELQKQSKLEKYEREINRLIEKNNGKLFVIKHEKSQGSDDGDYSKDYTLEGSYIGGSKGHHGNRADEPIFKISIKPRSYCKAHKNCLQDF